jgi:hypothetical protein
MSHGLWNRVVIGASLLALAGLVCDTTVSHAQSAGPNTGKISLRAGVDFTTAYMFRGILQEDEDFIAQPFGEITITLHEGSEALNSVTTTLGIWNSFHSGPTGGDGPTDDPKSWYELDFYGGVNFTFLEKFQAGVIYTAYISPNDSFGTVNEIALRFAFDDKDLLGAFALSPSILIAFEIDGQADGGAHEGIYLQIGIQPGLTLIESEEYPVTLSFPVTVGLSLDDYYEFGTGDDDTFGYLSLGAVFGMPLAFIPASFGSWEIHAGVQFFFLGDNLEAVNDGDSFKALGVIGLSVTY